jgi:hypothetical protein
MDEEYSKRPAEDAGEYVDEADEWLRVTPAERFEATTTLWEFYLAMGESLDPDPDPQSPFNSLYYPETPDDAGGRD